jgi:hypothetical protein
MENTTNPQTHNASAHPRTEALIKLATIDLWILFRDVPTVPSTYNVVSARTSLPMTYGTLSSRTSPAHA